MYFFPFVQADVSGDGDHEESQREEENDDTNNEDSQKEEEDRDNNNSSSKSLDGKPGKLSAANYKHRTLKKGTSINYQDKTLVNNKSDLISNISCSQLPVFLFFPFLFSRPFFIQKMTTRTRRARLKRVAATP